MPSIPIDTYRLVNVLKQRGFSEQQAGGIVEVLQEIDLGNLASKQDIRNLEMKLRELELRMTIKLGGLIVAGTGVLAALQLLR